MKKVVVAAFMLLFSGITLAEGVRGGLVNQNEGGQEGHGRMKQHAVVSDSAGIQGGEILFDDGVRGGATLNGGHDGVGI